MTQTSAYISTRGNETKSPADNADFRRPISAVICEISGKYFQKNNFRKIISVFILTAINTGCGSQTVFDATLKSIYKNTVPQIQAKKLYASISTDASLVLLDAREHKEYAVSHIKNAVFAGYENFDTSFFFSIPKQSKIIIYCSIGYRSERIGERFLQHGFSNVFNLYGGILNWMKEGYEVVDDNQKPTNRIHAYSKSWGRFLRGGEKVYD